MHLKTRYIRLNSDALALAEAILPDVIVNCPENFRLSTPSRHHAAEADCWSDLAWLDNFGIWQRLPKGVGCAILANNRLCGLGIGVVGAGSVNLTMMEGNPNPAHPFKGHVLAVLELFGFALCELADRAELRLINPLDGALDHYLAHGFTLVEGALRFCVKAR